MKTYSSLLALGVLAAALATGLDRCRERTTTPARASFAERFTFSGATTTPRERSRRITLPSAQFDEPYNAGMFLGIPARAEERA